MKSGSAIKSGRVWRQFFRFWQNLGYNLWFLLGISQSFFGGFSGFKLGLGICFWVDFIRFGLFSQASGYPTPSLTSTNKFLSKKHERLLPKIDLKKVSSSNRIALYKRVHFFSFFSKVRKQFLFNHVNVLFVLVFCCLPSQNLTIDAIFFGNR